MRNRLVRLLLLIGFSAVLPTASFATVGQGAKHFVLNDREFVATSHTQEPTTYRLTRGQVRIDVTFTIGKLVTQFEGDKAILKLKDGTKVTVTSFANIDPCPQQWDWAATWTRNNVSFVATGCGNVANRELGAVLTSLQIANGRLVFNKIDRRYRAAEISGPERTVYLSNNEAVEIYSEQGDPWPMDEKTVAKGARRKYDVFSFEPGLPLVANWREGNRNVRLSGKVSRERLVALAEKVKVASPQDWTRVTAELKNPNRPVLVTSTQVGWGPEVQAVLWPKTADRCRTISLRVSSEVEGVLRRSITSVLQNRTSRFMAFEPSR